MAMGQGVSKIKNKTIGGAIKDTGVAIGKGAKNAYKTVKAAPKSAAIGGAAGLGAGYAMGRNTDDDEEAELKAIIAELKARGEM